MHNNQIKTRKNSMLLYFRDISAIHNLSFTSQEIVRNMVMGLDGPKRRLLIVEENKEEFETRFINLFEVNTCKVKKTYAAIDSEEYKRNRRPEAYLTAIALEFEFKSGRPPVAIPFYRNEINSIYEITELETRARNWETMLSKLLPPRQDTTAWTTQNSLS